MAIRSLPIIDGVKLEQSFLKVNNLHFHVVQAGPPDGDLVILLHGFPEFWYGWRKQILPLVAAGFRVWMPDQRGYNLSDKPHSIHEYRLNKLAMDVIGLIEIAGRDRAALIGHDWGAAVAWHTAQNFPNKVAKLGILNVPHPAIMISTLQRSLKQLLMSWYIFAFQIPWIPERIARSMNWAFLSSALRNTNRPETFSEADLVLYREAWAQPNAITGMLNWYRAAFRSGIRHIGRARLHNQGRQRIHPPTLMLWGVNDTALSHEMAQPSISLCDDGNLIFFEGASHWIQHEEAAQVNRNLIEFLKE
jgi:pimeloyl-ACP methyl ester carboxylesterase